MVTPITTTSPSSFAGVRYTHLELKIDREEYFETLQDAVALFQGTRMHLSPQEVFMVLGFGGQLNIATLFEVGRGTPAYVQLHFPTLFGGLLAAGCERFWLAHNHPSNDVEPSDADVEITVNLMNAANIMRFYFEDHLILAPNGKYLSLEAYGVIGRDPESPYLADHATSR